MPSIVNLVFLRRVNSRILYEQMLGRATRQCPDIGKETFRIFDAVDLYPHLQDMTEMKPIVVNPKISLEALFEELALAEAEARIREQARHLAVTQLINTSAAIYQIQRAALESVDPYSRAVQAATATALSALTGVQVTREATWDRLSGTVPPATEEKAPE